MSNFRSNNGNCFSFIYFLCSTLKILKNLQILNNYHISLLIRRCFFSFQNNPKTLDPSYKMDLDLWDGLGRVKVILQQNCIGLI